MVGTRWLAVAVALACLGPWDQAGAAREPRRWGPAESGRTSAGTERVAARGRDSAAAVRRRRGLAREVGERRRAETVRGSLGAGRAVRGGGPYGVVRGTAGAERAARDREATGTARVDLQIDRTRRALDLVRDRVERCGDGQARTAVRRALEMQERAESAARAGRELGALQLTRGAREQGLEALRACGDAGRAPEGVVSALGRTDELLTLERRRLPADAPAVDRSAALERAAAAQRRAHEEFRRGRFDASLRLTQEARRSLRTAERRPEAAPRDAARPGPERRDATRPDGERRD